MAEMIVKVKEPQPAEYRLLREEQILFTYLHLAADLPQAEGLMQSGCVAIAYETVTDRHGRLPLLAPMSEVAGPDERPGRRPSAGEDAGRRRRAAGRRARACTRPRWW